MAKLPMSERELEIAIALFEDGMSLTKISKLLGRDRNNMAKKFNEKGIETKQGFHNKKSFNKNFFDEWNEKSAYWLGFIFADGHLSNKNGLEVCIKDKEHIEKFKADINSEHKVSTRIVSGYAYYRITIHDTYLGNQLRNLGVVNNKTYYWEIPKVPDEYMRHFIRGVFDGDGSFHIDKNTEYKGGHCTYSIVSYNIEVLNSLKNAIVRTSNLTEQDIHIYDNKNRVPCLNICTIKGLDEIFHYMYSDATVYLDRKYNKYLDYCRLKTKR